MEKFGIFELLDALSALSDSHASSFTKQPQPNETVASETSESENAVSAPEQPLPVSANTAAVASFLARHDALSKRADKRK